MGVFLPVKTVYALVKRCYQRSTLRFKGESEKISMFSHNLQKFRTKMRLELMLQSVRKF